MSRPDTTSPSAAERLRDLGFRPSPVELQVVATNDRVLAPLMQQLYDVDFNSIAPEPGAQFGREPTT
jgi:hypothetical protein